MKEKTPKPRTLVYLPADAKLNFENNTQDPPNTKYDNRKKIFDEESIKKLLEAYMVEITEVTETDNVLPLVKIKSIRFQNFKVFDDYTFDFSSENGIKEFVCFIGQMVAVKVRY